MKNSFISAVVIFSILAIASLSVAYFFSAKFSIFWETIELPCITSGCELSIQTPSGYQLMGCSVPGTCVFSKPVTCQMNTESGNSFCQNYLEANVKCGENQKVVGTCVQEQWPKSGDYTGLCDYNCVSKVIEAPVYEPPNETTNVTNIVVPSVEEDIRLPVIFQPAEDNATLIIIVMGVLLVIIIILVVIFFAMSK